MKKNLLLHRFVRTLKNKVLWFAKQVGLVTLKSDIGKLQSNEVKIYIAAEDCI